jgi:ParB/RepB/Spo0J family partition protein
VADEAKSIEDLRSAELDIRTIPLDLIDPDEKNPNEMDPALYDGMLRDIRERGYTQPILVWPRDGRFQMIDGEHRWRALGELGYAAAPAVVIEAESEDEARLKLLTMNRFRGQFVPIKLAYLLADLATRIPEKEMSRRLGMDDAELRDSLRLAHFTDDLGIALREAQEREAKDAPTVLSFVCAQRDAQAIERAVEALTSDKLDRGQALAKICRGHEKAEREKARAASAQA